MKLIAGLGNPGKEYAKTRHNAGFMVLDRLAEKCGAGIPSVKWNAEIRKVRIGSENVLLMKPLTYMNESGKAVVQAVNYYHIEPEDILVIHDDMDLPTGNVRIRKNGSSGGQKGMGSIISQLGSQDINRIRVGISNDRSRDTKDYVLSAFSKDELPLLRQALDKGSDALIYALDHDFDEVMSKFN